MRKAGLWGLLWVFFVSEVKAAIVPAEERYDLVEGQTLTVGCPFNIMKYASSRKAWQRLPAGKEPLTLAVTETSSTRPSEVHVGKYILKDDPTEAMLVVEMTDLQVTDSGLYRCVIYHPPNDPVLLFHPVRLVVTKGSSDAFTPDIIPTTTFITTKHSPSDTTTTRSLPKPTAVVSSPDPGVTNINGTDAARSSMSSVIVPVVCGLLIKTLVFTVLFIVTQRSFR
ncbi:triggering receptor expressed on myeloid cells 1-like [Apodemus sylvaticus]|uniref:triggering receptor expressed on myeloid cells 1-like n=1 Tax=Apodemus sylvaticus TaxID=10129 RepID=UPI0022438A56|nr:triggering receptor expressed on myeloid cells 1-like [Apodemus sylvaticus]